MQYRVITETEDGIDVVTFDNYMSASNAVTHFLMDERAADDTVLIEIVEG